MTVIVPGKPKPPIIVEPVVDGPVTVQVGRPGPPGPPGPEGPPGSGGGAGVTDGDKGDITVSGSGAVWTVNSGVITLDKLGSIATDSFLGRDSAGTGTPEVITPAQARTILNVANGATANATDAFLVDRANHTGTQLAGTISNFGATTRTIALTGFVAAGTRVAVDATDSILNAFQKVQKWLSDLAAVAFSGSASDLGTGTLSNARLGAFGSGDVSFASGGGAGTIADNAVTLAKMADIASNRLIGRTTAGSGDPEVLAPAAVRTMLNVADGAQVNVPTDLAYTASTRLLASSTGTDVTLPLAGSDPGLMSAADKTKLNGLPPITVSTTAPGSPAIGDLWVDTNP